MLQLLGVWQLREYMLSCFPSNLTFCNIQPSSEATVTHSGFVMYWPLLQLEFEGNILSVLPGPNARNTYHLVRSMIVKGTSLL